MFEALSALVVSRREPAYSYTFSVRFLLFIGPVNCFLVEHTTSFDQVGGLPMVESVTEPSQKESLLTETSCHGGRSTTTFHFSLYSSSKKTDNTYPSQKGCCTFAISNSHVFWTPPKTCLPCLPFNTILS